MRSGVYRHPLRTCWLFVTRGGGGAEYSYLPRTNDVELYWLIEDAFEWSTDFAAQQNKLDAFAEEHGLDEVPLEKVRRTYPNWEYGKDWR